MLQKKTLLKENNFILKEFGIKKLIKNKKVNIYVQYRVIILKRHYMKKLAQPSNRGVTEI